MRSSSTASSAPTGTSDPEAQRPTPLKNVAPQLTASGKKQRCADSDPWEHYGRGFIRMHNLLDACGKIMEEGMQVEDDLQDAEDRGDEDYWEELGADARRWVLSWRPLHKKLLSDAPDSLKTVEMARQISAKIDRGCTAAKQSDTNSIKARVPVWIEKHYGIQETSLTDKRSRGYKHPLTAKLLTPCTLIYNEENRLKLLTGKIKVSGTHWQRFLYKDIDAFNENPKLLDIDPWDGFMQNELLVMCFKHVFTSPSSADKENTDETVSTRSGNADLHGMDEVTIGSLAYIAAQARAFSKSDANADVTGFYGTIYSLLSSPDEKVNVKQLLKWWNRRIFPGGRGQVLTADSTLNFFHAAAKRRKAAEAALAAAAALAVEAEVGPNVGEVEELD